MAGILYRLNRWVWARLTTTTTSHSRLTPRETTHSHKGDRFSEPVTWWWRTYITTIAARDGWSITADLVVRTVCGSYEAEGCGWVMIISVYNILLLLPIIILLLSYEADYRRRDWRSEWGGRGGTTRDRSSSSLSVQIFSQRVDDFYIYYL